MATLGKSVCHEDRQKERGREREGGEREEGM